MMFDNELTVDYDLRTNPWPKDGRHRGVTGQLEFWMSEQVSPANHPRARALYATPIYEQTVAQLAPEPIVYRPYTTDDAWYEDDDELEFAAYYDYYDEEGGYS